MRSILPLIADELGADERTLRRAVNRGMVRCSRPSQRRLQLASGERDYLRGHWPVLSALTRALRTEPNVRLAVLYGSVARGDEREDSDLDLLVAFRDDSPAAASGLGRRLERALRRTVDIGRLSRVQVDSPLLLLQAIDEGRLVVDRDDEWRSLRRRRRTVASAARRAESAERTAAATALAELLEG